MEGNCITHTCFSTHGKLVRIGEQNILFTRLQQAVFTLNDTAADIWWSLDDGVPLESIALSIARCGVDAAEAAKFVTAALQDWERVGLISPCPPPLSPTADRQVNQMVAVGGLCVRIVYPDSGVSPSATVFHHLEVQERQSDIELQCVAGQDRIQLYRDGEWILSCMPEELPTMLKGQLLGEVLDRGAYQLALHAAAVLRNDRLCLLCGGPGSGKTTLTLALVQAGFGFAADDVTLLDAQGLGWGLPFAPAVKAGAWPVLAKLCPELDAAPIFRRPDGRRVRYPVVKAPALSSSHWPVNMVVLLRRKRGHRACLEPLEPADALGCLLSGAYAPGLEVSDSAFDALTRVVRSARAYRLTYSALPDATSLIEAEFG